MAILHVHKCITNDLLICLQGYLSTLFGRRRRYVIKSDRLAKYRGKNCADISYIPEGDRDEETSLRCAGCTPLQVKLLQCS